MPREDRVPSVGYGEIGETVLPCGPAAPWAARAAVTEWLSGLVGTHKLDDIRIVVTELVSNSVRHAQLKPGDAVTVRIQLAEHSLRIEVANPGTAGEIASNGGGPHAAGGVGLQLVERLCLAWGIARDRDTTVWGEIERAGR